MPPKKKPAKKSPPANQGDVLRKILLNSFVQSGAITRDQARKADKR